MIASWALLAPDDLLEDLYQQSVYMLLRNCQQKALIYGNQMH